MASQFDNCAYSASSSGSKYVTQQQIRPWKPYFFLFYIISRLFFRSTSARTHSGRGDISTCSYSLVHVRMLSFLSLVQIGRKTQDTSFPCLFWLLVCFLFRFVSVYKYVSLFVFFLNPSFSIHFSKLFKQQDQQDFELHKCFPPCNYLGAEYSCPSSPKNANKYINKRMFSKRWRQSNKSWASSC